MTEDRLSLLLKMLITENELLGLERDLEDRVRSEIDKDQHNYYLREQLKVINEELGEDSPASEAEELRAAAAASGMPESVIDVYKRQVLISAIRRTFFIRRAMSPSLTRSPRCLPRS